MKDMEVRKVSENTFDIFIGNGWMNWTRVTKKGHHLNFVKGRRLPRIKIVEAVKTIEELN